MARRRASRNSDGPRRPARPKKVKRKGGRSLLSKFVYAGLVLCLWGVIGIGGVVAYYASQLPPIDQLTVPKRPPNIAIMASDGSLLANRGETGGRTVTLKELPPYLPKAFVAIEDRRFYDHFGIDPIGISRAVYRNLAHKGGLQGGSTLTQQLAKNLFLTQERTASRKIQEAILALWLERNYSKDQILELYLNRVYFGAGAYGVEAAAQRYYGKSARSISLSEAAVLAGLVQSPSRLAPNRNPERAQARAELVIAAMNDLGFITPGMTKTALGAPAEPVRPKGAGSANYAADYVMDVLDDFVGNVESDIVVSTTVEPAMQAAAERVLVDELNAKGEKFNVSQGAFVAMQPDGAVRALVGGRNYETSQFNRARETAALAGFTNVETTADLSEGGLVVTPNENNRRAKALRDLLAKLPAEGTNTLLVTHKPNIIDALGKDWFDVKEGEASIFKPEAGTYRLFARVTMEDWPMIAAATH